MLGQFKSSGRAFLMLDVRHRKGDLSPSAADSFSEDGSDADQPRGGRGRSIGIKRGGWGGGGGRIVRERGVVHGHILREGGHASVRACAWRSASHLMLEWGPRPERAVCL